MSNGEIWQQHRKFMTRTLKDMGVGKHSINSHINEEFLACFDHLNQLCKKVSEYLPQHCGNSFSQILNLLFLESFNSNGQLL